MKPAKIISGGQTGADRGALEFALGADVLCGGFCPKGRVAEDGRIPDRFPLTETSSSDYPERTRKNVEESDATIIFDASAATLSRGSRLTVKCAVQAAKPYVVLTAFPDLDADAKEVRKFLERTKPGVLNVAGNRESGTPGIQRYVTEVLTRALS